MAYNKKTWKNRISENPLRRIITNVTTGVSETVDVTRYEGIITEAGDAFSAANMNDLESRIEQGINDAGSSDIIAATEEGPLSAHAYTIGQYLIYNKINYRVVQPIAVGNSLVPGTNLVEKKVADELSNHLVVNGNAFYFDVHDGEYGYNTSELRGADTFVPFKRSISDYSYVSGGAVPGRGSGGTYSFSATAGKDYLLCYLTQRGDHHLTFTNASYKITPTFTPRYISALTYFIDVYFITASASQVTITSADPAINYCAVYSLDQQVLFVRSPQKLTNCTFNVQTSSPVSYYGTVLDCGYQSGIIGKENVAITGSRGEFCHMYDTGPNVSSGYGQFDITIDPSTGLVKLISRSSSWGWLLNYPSVVDLVIW